eukprot:12150833-Prorocentrum_lima.AAC.1
MRRAENLELSSSSNRHSGRHGSDLLPDAVTAIRRAENLGPSSRSNRHSGRHGSDLLQDPVTRRAPSRIPGTSKQLQPSQCGGRHGSDPLPNAVTAIHRAENLGPPNSSNRH